MRRSRGFFSRALITMLFAALILVGLPVGSPVTSPGHTDLGLGQLWSSLVELFTPEPALAQTALPTTAQAAPPEPPKRVREVAEKRSATAKVFEMSDGRTEVVLSAQPQHFKNDSGAWQDIDTTIIDRGHDGYRFTNDSNIFRSSFGDKSGRLVRFQFGNKHVALGIAGESRVLSPQVAGDTVTYPDAFGGSADLEYEVTGEALKERIILPAPPGEPVFRFTMRLGGVTARAQPDGSIGFFAKGDTGELGPPVFVMPKPFMFDRAQNTKSPHGGCSVTRSPRPSSSRVRTSRSPSRPTKSG